MTRIAVHRLRSRQLLDALAPSEVRRDFGLTDGDKLIDTSIFSLREVATLARFSTPPGTFVDLSPVHLLSTTSLASLSPDGRPFHHPTALRTHRPLPGRVRRCGAAGHGARRRSTGCVAPQRRCADTAHPARVPERHRGHVLRDS